MVYRGLTRGREKCLRHPGRLDMRQMVPAMPGIELQGFRQGDVALIFGVVVVALPILCFQTQPKLVPSVVQAVQNVQTGPHVEVRRIRRKGPSPLVIGLDRWILFGQSQLTPNKAIHMAIGQVVYDLRSGPALRTVRGLQLLIGNGIHRLLQLLRKVR